MAQNTFTSNVVRQEAFQVVGLKVRTTMADSGIDCPRIWQDFGPRMAEIATGSDSFGVSVMIDCNTFDYWATLPYQPGSAVPSGMAVLDIPDGFYARCDLNSLDELTAAYMYLFEVWSNNSEYELRTGAPSFELYPSDFYPYMKHLSVYMPLRKQEK